MATANAQIPAVCDEAIRVVTYNVHHLKDIRDKHSNLSDILNDVRGMNPTVVIMEEVPDKGADREQLDKDLEGEGYKYRAEGYFSGAWLGNVIYSRLPLTGIKVTQLGHKRAMVRATIGGIHLYGTHLEVSDGQVRENQAKQIIKEMNLSGKSLLVGDMNEQANGSAMQHFTSHGLTESFASLNWPAATYTCWAGTPIDFILLSSTLKADLLGSYVYHTTSSDHLPIIVDIRMSKEAQSKAQSKSNIWKWIFIGAGCLILLLVAGLLVWYFCLRTPYPVLPK